MTDYFTSSAQLDEHMAKVVQDYPLLYDKQKHGYRDEGMKAQTWQKVADECDVGTGRLCFVFLPQNDHVWRTLRGGFLK